MQKCANKNALQKINIKNVQPVKINFIIPSASYEKSNVLGHWEEGGSMATGLKLGRIDERHYQERRLRR